MSRGLKVLLILCISLFALGFKSYAQAPQLCGTAPIVEDPTVEDTATGGNMHPCADSIPVFFVDLSGNPDSVWETNQFIGESGPNSPNYTGVTSGITSNGLQRFRNKDMECETCCDFSPNSKKSPSDGSQNNACIGFVVTLDVDAAAINFEVTSGALPGILEWTLMDYSAGTCSLPQPAGEDICLTGGNTYYINFCKPGDNRNHYRISSIPFPEISPTDVVSEACSGKVWASGYDFTTTQWSPISTGDSWVDTAVYSWMYDFNGNPTDGTLIDTLVVVIDSIAAVDSAHRLPDSIQFVICGSPNGACDSTITICDTTVVRFVSNLDVDLQPKNPAICFGSSFVTLTATGLNGDPPYIYDWYKVTDSVPINFGSGFTDTFNVGSLLPTGAGDYYVSITDQQGCSANGDTTTVLVYPSPIALDLGNDTVACANDSCLQLNASVEIAGGMIWLDSLVSGSFSVNDSTDSLGTVTATYCPSSAEVTAGSVSLIGKTTDNRTCDPVYDTIVITYAAPPVANAGPSDSVCENNPTICLQGSYQNATGATWSGGGGSYSTVPQDTAACYTLSGTEITNGLGGDSTVLTLTTTGQHFSCAPATDSMAIWVGPQPTVSAGNDTTLCSNNPDLTLAATSSTGTGSWSGGLGTFASTGTNTSTDPNDTYTPDPSELPTTLTPTTVSLIWSSTNNGLCNPVADTITVTYNRAPTADIAIDSLSVCENNDLFTVTGTTTPVGPLGVSWYSDAPFPTGFADSTQYSTTVDPSGYTSPDTFNLSFCVLPANGCLAECDTMVVDILGGPSIDITPNYPISALNNFMCYGTFENFSATFSGAGGISWWATYEFDEFDNVGSFSGPRTLADSSIFSSTTDSSVNVTPNQPMDPFSNGASFTTVYVYVKTTNNGLCNEVRDSSAVTIFPPPDVVLQADTVLCNNNAVTVTITGTVSSTLFGSTPYWNDTAYAYGATGSFSNQTPVTLGTGLNQVISNTYTFGTEPGTLTTVPIKVCANPSFGQCVADCDSMQIDFVTPPTALAGNDQVVCSNNAQVTVTGDTIRNGAQGPLTFVWRSLSSPVGTFAGNDTTSISATYDPSATQISPDSGWCMEFEVSDQNYCAPVTDTMCVSVTPAPVVYAGPDDTICYNNPDVTLSGSITDGATTGQWSGAGTFLPGPTSLNPVYTPTQAELDAGSFMLILCSTNGMALNNCNEVCDTMFVTVTPAPTVNAGPDDTACVNNPVVTLAGSFNTSISGGIVWSSYSGTFISGTSDTDTNGIYSPDATEYQTGNVTMDLIITTTGSGLCNEVSDTMNIFFEPSPVVDAGNRVLTCENNPVTTISGTVTNAGGGTWSVEGGTGTFSPHPDSLNATFTNTGGPVAGDSVKIVLTSTGSSPCNEVRDSFYIVYTNAPIVDAGDPDTSCANNTLLSLNAHMQYSSTGVWSGYSGTFIGGNNTDTVVNYSPSASEIADSIFTLTYTSTDNGNCFAVSDSVTLKVIAVPQVSAGPDQTVCADAGGIPITLAGSVSGHSLDGALTGQWFGDLPTITPSSSSLTGTYTPPASVIPDPGTTEPDTARLILVSVGSQYCNAKRDTVDFIIMPAPIVDAGGDQTVCSSEPSIPLSPTSTNADGTWSLGAGASGTFTGNNYNRSLPGDTANSPITLRYCSSNHDFAACLQVCDSLEITLQSAPVAVINVPDTICSTDGPVSISAAGSSTGSWSGGIDGTFANINSVNTTYTLGSNDIALGSVTFTWTTTPSGSCPSFDSTKTSVIYIGPTVLAGPDTTLCSDVQALSISGSITGGTGTGSWRVPLGQTQGVFSPNNTLAATSYTFDADNYADGGVDLMLCSSSDPYCNIVCDTLEVTLTPNLYVFAGIDRTICGDQDTLQLRGDYAVAGGAIWTTDGANGSGAFSDDTSMTAVYTWNDPADTTGGNVIMNILTTTDTGTCRAVRDTMYITITEVPQIDAGIDDTACYSQGSYQLNGSYYIATEAIWTNNTTGANVYSATANDQNATYTFTSADSSMFASKTHQFYYTTTSTGQCNPVTDTMNLTILPNPIAIAGTDASTCADAGSFNVNGQIFNADGGIWSHTSDGVFASTGTASSTTLNDSYIFGPSDTNGVVVFKLKTFNAEGCLEDSSTFVLTINPSVIIDAGSGQTLCASGDSIQLNGYIANAGGVYWSSPTGGEFVPDSNTVDPIYVKNSTDSLNGSVVLTIESRLEGLCQRVTDSVTINFDPIAEVDAGPNDTICADTAGYLLNGTVNFASGGHWSSSGDSAFFVSPDTLVTTFVPSDNDTIWANQPITIYLTSTGNGTCNPVTDSMLLTITPIPYVNLIPYDTICADQGAYGLVTNFGVADSIMWSTTGSGTIANIYDTSTTYTFDNSLPAGDTVVRDLQFRVTTIGNGKCNSYSEQLQLYISPAPFVDAGANTTICVSQPTFTVVSSEVHFGDITWTSSDGAGNFDDPTSLNPTYTHNSTVTTTSDTVYLYINNSNVGTCNPIYDSMRLIINPIPIISAGVTDTICADSDYYQLSATFQNAVGGYWTGTTGGTFAPDSISPTATYYPSSTDTANGYFSLIWTSRTPLTGCSEITDTVTVTITDAPTVNAGPPQRVCADAPAITLAGSVTVATGGLWTTSGDGAFSNTDATTLNATYTPGASDISVGMVNLTLTTTGNGLCNPVDRSMILTIDPAPTVYAGIDRTVCISKDSLILNGSFTNATGITWSTSGNGSFDNVNALNPVYTPDRFVDSIRGTISMVACTYDTVTNCISVCDTSYVTFTPTPSIVATSDSICANTAGVTLSATRYNASGVFWSTNGSGGGSEFSNTGTDTTFFTPNSADIPGSIQIYVRTDGHVGCTPVYDTVEVDIRPIPVVDAGNAGITCSDQGSITVGTGASITNSTGANRWYAISGGGTFASPTATFTTTYSFSAVDMLNGYAAIELCTENNGICPQICDQDTIIITGAPNVYAGADITRCKDEGIIDLTGAVQNGAVNTGLQSWTTSNGTGTFLSDTFPTSSGAPPASVASRTYTLSAADTANLDTLFFTLCTENNGYCFQYCDNKVVRLTPAPTLSLPDDDTICADANGYAVTASFTVGTGGQWTYSGSPDTLGSNLDTGATITYFISDIDTAAGAVGFEFCLDEGLGRCSAICDSFNLVITPAPDIFIDDSALCASADSVLVGARYNSVSSGIYWTTYGDGFFGDSLADTTYYYFGAGDKAGGTSITILASTRGMSPCQEVSDTLQLNYTDPYMVTAGTDQYVCSDTGDVQLNGGHNAPVTAILWTTTGNGTFGDNTDTLSTYTLGQDDIDSGFVDLVINTNVGALCPEIDDTVRIGIYQAPVVNAAAVNACAESDTIDLNGSILDTLGNPAVGYAGYWGTDGDGSFSADSSDITGDYIRGTGDSTNGTFLLTLTTRRFGECHVYQDTLRITLIPVSTVDLPVDTFICKDADSIQLRGYTFSDTGTYAIWSGGNGTFAMGDIAAGTDSVFKNDSTFMTYYFDAADTTGVDSMYLYLTNQGGQCSPAIDSILIRFNPIPIVTAIPAIQCALFDTIALSGTITNAGGGTWTIDKGAGFLDLDPDTINNFYVPAAADTTGPDSSDYVQFFLCSRLNAGCKSYCDTARLYFAPPPAIYAGPDLVVCADVDTVCLDSAVVDTSASAGGVWTTAVTPKGWVPDDSSYSACYIIPDSIRYGTNDTTFTLTLTTFGSGFCPEISDSLEVTVTHPPVISGIPDTIFVCGDTTNVPISVTYNDVLDSVQWNVISGDGSVAVPTDSATTYGVTAVDTANGTVVLGFEGYDFGNCRPLYDTVVIQIGPIPTVNAGPAEICIDNPTVSLNATITHDGVVTPYDGVWTSSTQGTSGFSQTPSWMQARYTLDSASGDTLGAIVILTLTTTNNGLCKAYSDSIILNIIPAPDVIAGADQSVCGDNDTVYISATKTTDSARWYAPTGTGFFGDSLTDTTYYVYSSADSASGNFCLYYETTFDNRGCNPGLDSLCIAIIDAPTVDAGLPDTACYESSPGIRNTIQLDGTYSFAGGIEWTAENGALSDFNDNTDTNAIYQFVQADSGQSILFTISTTNSPGCNPVTDTVRVFVRPLPTLTDNADTTVCGDIDSVIVSTILQNAVAVSWTTSGDGFYGDSTALTTAYYPGTQDVIDSFVVLEPSTVGNFQCDIYSEDFTVYFSDIPEVYAGPDMNKCSDGIPFDVGNLAYYRFNGVDAPGVYSWTTIGGAGTFTDSSQLIAEYNPDPQNGDSASIVPFVLTVCDTISGCKCYSDTLLVQFAPEVVVTLGADDTVCADIGVMDLVGNVAVGVIDFWSTLDGDSLQFNPLPPDQDSVQYVLTPADTARGTITFVLTSKPDGNCSAKRDTITYAIQPQPRPFAGDDDSICADMPTYLFGGTYLYGWSPVEPAWTSNGNGSFDDTTILNPTYTFDPATDLNVPLGGSNLITFTMTTTNNRYCNPRADVKQVKITELPIVDAGNDFLICQDVANGRIDFSTHNASIDGSAKSAVWSTTNGNGRFLNSGLTVDSSLAGMVYYEMDPADILLGNNSDSLEFVLTTNSQGSCNPVSDTMYVHLKPAPAVTATPDRVLCADQDTINICATVSNADNIVWNSSPFASTPTGDFEGPNDSCTTFTIDESLKPQPKDGAYERITLIIQTYDNKFGCNEVSDTILVDVGPAPYVEIFAPDTVCIDEPTMSLDGDTSIFNYGANTGGVLWSTAINGGGSFNTTTSLPTTYTFGGGDATNLFNRFYLCTTDNGLCNAVCDTHDVTIMPAPILTASMDTVICGDWTTLNLRLNEALSQNIDTNNIVWSVIDEPGLVGNQSFITDRFDNTTTYVIQDSDRPPLGSTTSNFMKFAVQYVNDAYCNDIADTVIVEIKPRPTIEVSAGDICADETGIDIYVDSLANAGGFIWDDVASTKGAFTDPTATPTTYLPDPAVKPGVAVVFACATNKGTCLNDYCDSVTIFIRDLPNPDAGDDQVVCRNNEAVLSGDDVGNLGSEYYWYELDASGNRILPALSISQVQTVIVRDSGMYVFEIVDEKGCTRADSMRVLPVDPPEVTIDGPYCFTDSIEARVLFADTANSRPYNLGDLGGPDEELTWYIPQFDGTQSGQTVRPNNTGIITVVWSYGGCTAQDTALVHPLPVLESTDPYICAGFDVELSTTDSSNYNTYEWTELRGGTQAGFGNPITFQGDSTVDTIPGTEQLFTVKVTDNHNCSYTDTVRIYEMDKPNVDIDPGLVCSGDTATLIATPANDSALTLIPGVATYQWYFNEDSTSLLVPEDSIPGAISDTLTPVTEPGIYVVQYGKQECTVIDSVYLGFYRRPLTNAQDTAEFCSEGGETIVINAGKILDYKDDSIVGMSYIWNKPDDIIGTGLTALKTQDGVDTLQFAEVSVEQTYGVTISDSIGCTSEDSIHVKELCPPRCHLPTVFAPDGTECDPDCATNDDVPCPDNCFYIFCANQKDVNLTVFNRWGEIIFHYSEDIEADFSEAYWDGTFRGQPMPGGVYPWTMEYNAAEEEFDRPKILSGKIILIR